MTKYARPFWMSMFVLALCAGAAIGEYFYREVMLLDSYNVQASFISLLFSMLFLSVTTCAWFYSNHRRFARAAFKRQRQDLSYRANHDHLTELPNRSSLLKILKAQLTRVKIDHSPGFALLFIDLNRFKVVNDTLGHLVGDKLLEAVGLRLKEYAGVKSCFRFGGDEFVVCLRDNTIEHEVVDIAREYIDVLTEPFNVEGQTISLGASIGIAIITDGNTDIQDIIKRADVAMYNAKTNDNEIVVFRAPMQEHMHHRFSIEQSMSKALAMNEFSLVYQPIYDLATDRVAYFEALARWFNPKLGQVSPAMFIPIAEETGHINRIGNWVLDQVCATLAQWSQVHPPENCPGITVNVSAKQLKNPQFINTVSSLVKQYAFPPHLLGLEVTESCLITHVGVVKQHVSQLKALGVKLLLDDFGTGFSSLSLLQDYPFDTLKVDRSFITRINSQDTRATALCESIIKMSHSISLKVIAEGVENENQVNWLKERGCDYIQGFVRSKPLTDSELVSLIDANPHRSSIAPAWDIYST